MHPGHAVSGTAGRTSDWKTSGTAGGPQRAQSPAVRCRAAGLRHPVALACGRECRGAVQLPHLRTDADNSAAGADRAGEYPLWGLRHQSGLSGRNAGHPGLIGCVRHLWGAAAGGQRPRSLPALSARRAAAPHCTGGCHVLRLGPQDPAGGHRRRISAPGQQGPGAGESCSARCTGPVRLHQPVLPDPAVAGCLQPAVDGKLSRRAAAVLFSAFCSARGAERGGAGGGLPGAAGAGRSGPGTTEADVGRCGPWHDRHRAGGCLARRAARV